VLTLLQILILISIKLWGARTPIVGVYIRARFIRQNIDKTKVGAIGFGKSKHPLKSVTFQKGRGMYILSPPLLPTHSKFKMCIFYCFSFQEIGDKFYFIFL
jgi:hypothetical protein